MPKTSKPSPRSIRQSQTAPLTDELRGQLAEATGTLAVGLDDLMDATFSLHKAALLSAERMRENDAPERFRIQARQRQWEILAEQMELVEDGLFRVLVNGERPRHNAAEIEGPREALSANKSEGSSRIRTPRLVSQVARDVRSLETLVHGATLTTELIGNALTGLKSPEEKEATTTTIQQGLLMGRCLPTLKRIADDFARIAFTQPQATLTFEELLQQNKRLQAEIDEIRRLKKVIENREDNLTAKNLKDLIGISQQALWKRIQRLIKNGHIAPREKATKEAKKMYFTPEEARIIETNPMGRKEK